MTAYADYMAVRTGDVKPAPLPPKGKPLVQPGAVPPMSDELAWRIKAGMTDSRYADFRREMLKAEAGADITVEEHTLPDHSNDLPNNVVMLDTARDPWRGVGYRR